MPTKAEMYAQMAEQVAAKLTDSWQEWTGFLTTAARLYKYTFQDQMMIYAQRPDATACAEYDLWNDKMGRYVRRGSKGIALVDDTGDRPRLRYVFDISDTGTREYSRTPWLWQLEEQHKGPVSAMLERSYGASGNDLPQQIIDVAGKLAGAYWEDHRRDFFHIVDDSFLEEYDDYNIEMQFKAATTVSISYALMSRCGLEPERYFDREDFITISDFNSPATIGALGEAVSQSSEQVLRQIGVTIRNYEREHTAERSMNHGEQSDLHPERRLPDPEPDLERTAVEAPGQVRTDAESVPEGAPAPDLQSAADERETVPAPAGDRQDGEQPSGTDDAPAGEGSRSDGGAESPRPDEMGGPDEHLQGAGRGNPDGGTHQQLSFFLTEAEQIEQIDRRAETEKVSAFSFSGEDIALAMASGSGFDQGKERIAAYFAENHTPKERAEFLKKEYGIGGQSWTFLDGSHGFLEYNARGIQLRSYPEGQEQRFSWSDAAKRIGVLIAAGKYLDEPSEEEPIWEYNGVKERHPDNLVLYQMGDFYELYGEDARTAAAELDLNLFSRSIPGGGRVEMCGFPVNQLEQTVERLRDKHDVTVSAQQKGSAQRREYTVLSIDHEAEQAIDAHEAEFGADGFRAFPDAEAGKAATLRELHEKFKPIVVDAVIQDARYGNVCSDGDRERAVIEGRAAIQRAVLASGNQELLHLYSHIPEFRQRLTREVVDETYPKLYELLHPLSDTDIDKAIQAWNGKIESKHAVVRFMRDHAREKDTAVWLAHEYDGSDGKTPFVVRPGSPVRTELPWPKVQRRIAQLIKEDRFYTQVERDNLDDVDPVSIRETLADRGIVNGQVVEPEKLDNDPFIQQVVSDAEQAAAEPAAEAPEEPEALSDAEYARRNLIPGETAFDLDDRRFMVDQVDLGLERVSLRDVTFAEATGFPIFRSEPIWVIRQYLEQEVAPAKPEKPLTAEDVTDIRLESSSYSAVSREKEYHLTCKINGVPDTLVYTVSKHDDVEGFTIQSQKDDIWNKMSRPELEKLEDVLARAVEFDYWSKSIEHAADADALEVVALDYRWAEDLNLSDEQQDALWSQIAARRAQLTAQPTFTTEPVASYPAEETNLPYDVVVEKLHIEPPEPPEQESPAPPARNFHISDSHLGEGGPKQKFARNVEAIRTLQILESENRNATPEEQETLSQYVGWGGLADAFDPDKDSWAKEYAQLKELLSPEEYAAARASTLNAHYTSPTVIHAIYDAVEKMGFQTGNILEPSCGVGNFFGMLPENMAGSKLYGVELDSISGRIAQKLYPEANITVAGFETTKQQDFYDLAIGNVPFGNYKVNDKAYNNLGFSIHNYFFAKALDQVRPGGVVAFVTSRYTMDSKDSADRKYLAERADLLGAIRLPNNAFRANAGTDVVSDIIFLQKRDRPIDREPDWVQLGQTESGISINQYFVDHPEMVLGELTTESTQYGREESTVLPLEGADLGEQLKEAVNQIHGTYQEAELPDLGEGEAIETSIPADPNVKNYSYAVVDGTVYFRENSRMVRPELNATAEARVKGMVGLRGCVQELIELQMDAAVPDSDIQEKQAELNRLYDDFSAKYGLINDRANRLAFADDSSYYLLCALEVIDENGKLKSKADMFSKRTIKPHKAVTSVDTASEALAVSISEKACVDMEYMEQLTGKPRDELAEELKGVIFRLPEPVPEGEQPRYVTADEYLSGNVRKKLRQAQLAAQQDPSIAINVEALAAAQPKDLDASEIEVRLGATWIDKKYIQQFMYETFDTPFYMRHGSIQVNYSSYTAEWQITGKNYPSRNDVAAYTTYGTDRANAYRLLEDALNLRDIRIYDTIEDVDGREKRVLNAKETTLAAQKQQAIRDAFKDWIWQDPTRRQALVRQYNEEMNATRPREYDGSHITFGGMNPAITLREHQLGAIAHVLYGGNTLLAHEVGAGKTFEMVAAAMESKRLGLCQKSLFVVPNHLTEQWASEFLRLYPSAKILVTTKKDFESHNRKKFCSRIATGDYDAVIIGHSQFERIPISQERQERLLQEQIDEITEGIAEMKSNGGERFTIKQLERTRKSLEARLEKLQAEGRKDDVVTFEQLGVDRLFIDEAHNYKNLFLYTKMRNVAGLSTSDAQKSSDMFAKCRYMDEITGSRGVVFATGTPVSNSMTELYTMQRYLQYDRLQELNMTHFDCWASRFGETVTALELAPEGTGYRARTRFSKFFNLPELMNLFREVADIKTADQLHLPTPEVEYHNVVAQPTEQQQEMVKALSERASLVHSGTVDPSQDNMLKITSDGRKLGLDQRIINQLLPDADLAGWPGRQADPAGVLRYLDAPGSPVQKGSQGGGQSCPSLAGASSAAD